MIAPLALSFPHANDHRQWWLSVDGDAVALSIFRRHYSHQAYRDGRRPRLFVGPGEKIVLLTLNWRALFVWRKFRDDSIDERTGEPQRGVNCAVFRNEGAGEVRSSELIREADVIAWERWPGERHYTYVAPKKVRSTNPGYCFLMAGWQRCGTTKGGLVVLEMLEPCGGKA